MRLAARSFIPKSCILHMDYRRLTSILILFLALDTFLWYEVIFGNQSTNLEIDFFDVGQGDSHLIILEGVQILVDGGSDGSILGELAKMLDATDRYLDLLVLTHTDADHIGGLPQVLERYQIGAFIYNSRGSDSAIWREFAELIRKKNIPVIVVGEGDVITVGDAKLTVLNPGPEFVESSAPNDASIVMFLESLGTSVLLTGDIALATERYLLDKYNLDADILKVAHHGSKFATTKEFLAEVTSKVSIIQVGKNRHGHPTQEVLGNLDAAASRIYRNDLDGTLKVISDGEQIYVVKGKQRHPFVF